MKNEKANVIVQKKWRLFIIEMMKDFKKCEFSKKYGIPERTLSNLVSGDNRCISRKTYDRLKQIQGFPCVGRPEKNIVEDKRQMKLDFCEGANRDVPAKTVIGELKKYSDYTVSLCNSIQKSFCEYDHTEVAKVMVEIREKVNIVIRNIRYSEAMTEIKEGAELKVVK